MKEYSFIFFSVIYVVIINSWKKLWFLLKMSICKCEVYLWVLFEEKSPLNTLKQKENVFSIYFKVRYVAKLSPEKMLHLNTSFLTFQRYCLVSVYISVKTFSSTWSKLITKQRTSFQYHVIFLLISVKSI